MVHHILHCALRIKKFLVIAHLMVRVATVRFHVGVEYLARGLSLTLPQHRLHGFALQFAVYQATTLARGRAIRTVWMVLLIRSNGGADLRLIALRHDVTVLSRPSQG